MAEQEKTVDEKLAIVLEMLKGETSVNEILSYLNYENIEVYSFLKNMYANGNILENNIFQFVFRSYYRSDNAGLSERIKNHFFKLLAEKQKELEKILSELYKIPTLMGKNTIQFSFATKLLHTIDNNKPIFDSEIAKVTKLRVKGKSKKEKIHSCVDLYATLEKLYAKLLKNEKIEKVIAKFRLKFNADRTSISDTKALDFILWSLGKVTKNRNRTYGHKK